eukprot:scaffold267223_cov27-Tisochrysis_lutea.AAC.1
MCASASACVAIHPASTRAAGPSPSSSVGGVGTMRRRESDASPCSPRSSPLSRAQRDWRDSS